MCKNGYFDNHHGVFMCLSGEFSGEPCPRDVSYPGKIDMIRDKRKCPFYKAKEA